MMSHLSKGKQLGVILLFFLVLFSIHLFVIEQFSREFSLVVPIWVIFLLSVLFIVGRLLEVYVAGLRILKTISFVWLGLIFNGLWVYALFLGLSYIVSIPKTIPTLVIVLLSIYGLLNALSIHERIVTVVSKKVKKSVRIVQISDLHLGAIHQQDFLNKVVDHVLEYKPDYVAITGDLIDGELRPGTLFPLTRISCPVYYVTGNHEYYKGIGYVKTQLEQTQVVWLKKSITKGDIQFIGVDDLSKGEQLVKALKNETLAKKFNVLLHHRPHGIKEVSKMGVDLFLAGHTHNGQIFPFNFIVKIFYPYIKNQYTVGSMVLNVCVGSDTWGPPMRLGSVNEICVIDVKPK
ncbi:MAG: putative MPP superfamily phosphohydrolase [Candidatus Woesearchaeota archaeon]|jgi:predicted MPP superfamily phosphohydrolase